MEKDILFLISDQHSYKVLGYAGNRIVKTPALDGLAARGTVMRDCYAACPLCVPSRLGMLTGQYASSVRALTNTVSLDSNIATFVHSLNAKGYDTTLCGRMHFIGPDQRHGFAKRLVGDITPTSYGRKMHTGVDALPWNRGRIEHLAIQCMGGGESTVLAYDCDVVDAAEKYLSGSFDRPQFLCVGIYAPHFPYIAPPELFDYYYDRVIIPEDSFEGDEHPVFRKKLRDMDPQTVRAAMAAYYGMVEFMDRNIGRILKAWDKYLLRSGREGVVIYVSDHGDSNGEHGFYGKNTFFDASVHVPMIFAGAGIPEGKEIGSPVSLLDLSPTICEMTGAPCPPRQDGKSMLDMICGDAIDEERIVVSELINRFGAKSMGRMAKWRQYKYVTFSGFDGEDQLFDMNEDPFETRNLISEYPHIAQKLSDVLKQMKTPETVMAEMEEQAANLAIVSGCGEDGREQWTCRKGLAEKVPVPVISTKKEISF